MAAGVSSEPASETPQVDADRPSDDPQRYLTNPGQIAAVLRRLQEARPLLTVRLAERRLEFRSALLRVDAATGRLLLDELSPAKGHDLVRPGTSLRIICATHGVETRFDTEVLAVGVDNGIHFYVSRIPAEIYYRQRRRHMRVPLRRTLQEKVQLRDVETEETLPVTLVDLSEGGFGGHVDRAVRLGPGRRFGFTLKLRGDDEFSGEVEVRWEQDEKVRRRRRFGAQFAPLQRGDRKRLQRLVTTLQRELMRRT